MTAAVSSQDLVTDMAEGEYVTNRGFSGFAQFEDSYGADVRVQASSQAMYDAVWIFVKGGGIDDNEGSTHLNAQQARIVRDALNEFLEYAEDMDPEDNL
jgi:hypothetical protein